MRKLLNSLFVTTEDAYASLDGENIVIQKNKEELGRFPLHILEAVFLFTYSGASPSLMGKCAQRGINLVFCTPQGKYLARTVGESNGNVLLRRAQYRMADDPVQSCRIARNLVFGKVSNARYVLERTRRDHPQRIDTEAFINSSAQLRGLLASILEEESLESLRGLEGAAAVIYFNRFDDLLLRNKEHFHFKDRNRRPPTDNINALLSFVYMMLANDCASALEMVGLDAYVGFLHRDRPGRKSMALDLMEELRPCIADRFCLTLINNGILTANDFEQMGNGAVLITKNGRKEIQKAWQTRKQEVITHPFIKEKITWGLVPYVQAMLLARYLRGDLDGYPPFIWK